MAGAVLFEGLAIALTFAVFYLWYRRR